MRTQPNTRKTNALQKKITMAGLLANCSTAESRKLLKKHGIDDAINHEDLEVKISKLYHNTDDKKALEKELAEIHPHKEFILQNLAPNQKVEAIEEILPVDPNEPIREVIVEELPAEKTSGACGCSSADGSGVPAQNSSSPGLSNNQMTMFTIFGIITIFAMVVIKTSKSA